jgi:FkbM family methyltransferase
MRALARRNQRRLIEYRGTRRGRRHQARLAGPKLLRAFAETFPEAVFVEIGANDGEHHDHLRPILVNHAWRGVMVEPVPRVFDRLRANYEAFPGIALENAAIGERVGEMPFYHLESTEADEHPLPNWSDGLGSFSREVLLSHRRLMPDIESHIVATDVPCLTFDALCHKHGLRSVDLIAIDTEGYDYRILRTIDFTTYRPGLVVYEHYHLPVGERIASRAYVQEVGYETLVEGFDTWCLRADVDPRLMARWRALRPAAPEHAAEDEPQ